MVLGTRRAKRSLRSKHERGINYEKKNTYERTDHEKFSEFAIKPMRIVEI